MYEKLNLRQVDTCITVYITIIQNVDSTNDVLYNICDSLVF